MSSWKFRKRMLDLAAVEDDAPQESAKVTIHPSMSTDLYQVIARIARATGQRPVSIVTTYLKEHASEFEAIATAVEKVAPAERLKKPILTGKRTGPKVKDLKAFAAMKKGTK